MTTMKRAILLFPILCVACATTSQTQLNQTLQHYIGQSSDQVQNQLNLNSMGYKVLGAPVHTPEKLTYTLLRNMPIPMGTPNLGTSVSMGAPIPTPSSGMHLSASNHRLLPPILPMPLFLFAIRRVIIPVGS